MRKSILVFSLATLMLAGGIKIMEAQEQPKPKKDTVNIDTDAKPTFYYAEEETRSKSRIPTVAIISGVVVIVAVGAFFILKKKKV
jgi:hypothetical protein